MFDLKPYPTTIMKIAVILPVYNEANFIDQTFDII